MTDDGLEAISDGSVSCAYMVLGSAHSGLEGEVMTPVLHVHALNWTVKCNLQISSAKRYSCYPVERLIAERGLFYLKSAPSPSYTLCQLHPSSRYVSCPVQKNPLCQVKVLDSRAYTMDIDLHFFEDCDWDIGLGLGLRVSKTANLKHPRKSTLTKETTSPAATSSSCWRGMSN